MICSPASVEKGVYIALSRISTEKGAAIDTFYVADAATRGKDHRRETHQTLQQKLQKQPDNVPSEPSNFAGCRTFRSVTFASLMNVLILAAGYATRLYPLTLNKAKPLLEVAGKPMIEWVAG